ncbi:ribosomal RNA large subunit methyltransferase H [Campylobacterota bacterium]|nr:ribosomal RNA large subunit methyltransferase H [Campylobacterota bacterium]
MSINLLFIGKRDSLFQEAEDHFKQLIAPHAKLAIVPIFNARIKKAQEISREAAQKSYTEAFTPHLSSSFKIALSEKGRQLDSLAFAKLISLHSAISFFVGGSYGFEADFLSLADMTLSLSPLTLSHELARAVLLEQIYRACAINAHHPYHK